MSGPTGSAPAAPAERYARAKRRSRYPALAEFAATYPFQLDRFQVEAGEALEDGYGVLVCAPTGAGKTVVGEFAVHLALRAGGKCFYTTPIKALSNQKYADLVERYGAEQIGLLTGDNSVNPDAAIVVMTTEVLRNMLYAGSRALVDLHYVVLDEVHYLGDRFRGAVWEEAIIHLPPSVRLVSLSATVSNAEEFGEWLVSVRGDTKVIVHEQRPVPLWQHLLVGSRLFDLFDGAAPDSGKLNETLRRHLADHARRYTSAPYGHRASGHGGRERGWRPPDRPDVIMRLDRAALLPAITFIFSRAGCDAAMRQCLHAGLWLTSAEERDEISDLAESRTAAVAPDDLQVLGYWEWLDGLRRGFATHHAGMVPIFKEAVEALFIRGLVKAVFATETLALGVNMPARTVVLERLSKFNGETHADLTPGEYTQLTGRAGRRGIDVEGHAVVLWSPDVDPARLAGLASTRTYPLRSSFRPSYNMAVNLVAQLGRESARELLDSSFAQFQADRSVVGLASQIRSIEETLAGYEEKMACELGDFAGYAALRTQLSEREAAARRERAGSRHAAVVADLERLRPGDVLRLTRGRRAGLAIVLDAGISARDDPRPLVLTQGRWSGRLSTQDFTAPLEVLGRVRIPARFNHRAAADRRALAAQLTSYPSSPRQDASRRPATEDPQISRLRLALRAHPCHRCPDREEHARWAGRRDRLSRERDSLRTRIEGRTDSLGRAFDRICALLSDRGYLSETGQNGTVDTVDTVGTVGTRDTVGTVTESGRMLARVWSDSDLLVAECLRAGVWEGLDAAELAAVVSCLVYEPRRDEREVTRLPTSAVRQAVNATLGIWADLADDELERGLVRTREPELGFAWPAYRWARQEGLDRVIAATAEVGPVMSAGDFVRWCKQLLDLLSQLSQHSQVEQLGQFDRSEAGSKVTRASTVAASARAAIDTIRRGVIAQSMLA